MTGWFTPKSTVSGGKNDPRQCPNHISTRPFCISLQIRVKLWNEPNTVFWEDQLRGNVTEYAALAHAVDAARIAAGLRHNTTLVGPAVAGLHPYVCYRDTFVCYIYVVVRVRVSP